MLIVFVGGVTYTEIAAIRVLNRLFNEDHLKGRKKKIQFIILTTSILNSKKILENLGKEVKVIASHSNCFEICPHMRNLDDSQLLALKSVGGLLGLVSYSFFVTDKEEDLKEVYLKHIEHAVSIMGIDKVGVSSDDMTFSKVLFGEDYGRMVFDYSTISSDLKSLLLTKYSLEDVDKIMYKNIYNKLFN